VASTLAHATRCTDGCGAKEVVPRGAGTGARRGTSSDSESQV
jgi:hypothetical protein